MTGDELKQWRVAHGYTHRGLAAALGVGFQQIWKWEKGKVRVPPLMVLALSALECRRKEATPPAPSA